MAPDATRTRGPAKPPPGAGPRPGPVPLVRLGPAGSASPNPHASKCTRDHTIFRVTNNDFPSLGRGPPRRRPKPACRRTARRPGLGTRKAPSSPTRRPHPHHQVSWPGRPAGVTRRLDIATQLRVKLIFVLPVRPFPAMSVSRRTARARGWRREFGPPADDAVMQ